MLWENLFGKTVKNNEKIGKLCLTKEDYCVRMEIPLRRGFFVLLSAFEGDKKSDA